MEHPQTSFNVEYTYNRKRETKPRKQINETEVEIRQFELESLLPSRKVVGLRDKGIIHVQNTEIEDSNL